MTADVFEYCSVLYNLKLAPASLYHYDSLVVFKTLDYRSFVKHSTHFISQ